MKRKTLQLGISLLEVLLSLTIISIILVMATRYFFLATNNDRINMTRQQIGSVVAAIHGWKNQNPEYIPNLDLSVLYNTGMLTKSTSMEVKGQAPNATVTLYDPWGEKIFVAGATDHATVQVAMPKNSDCVALQNSYPEGTCDGKGGFTLNIV